MLFDIFILFYIYSLQYAENQPNNSLHNALIYGYSDACQFTLSLEHGFSDKVNSQCQS